MSEERSSGRSGRYIGKPICSTQLGEPIESTSLGELLQGQSVLSSKIRRFKSFDGGFHAKYHVVGRTIASTAMEQTLRALTAAATNPRRDSSPPCSTSILQTPGARHIVSGGGLLFRSSTALLSPTRHCEIHRFLE